MQNGAEKSGAWKPGLRRVCVIPSPVPKSEGPGAPGAGRGKLSASPGKKIGPFAKEGADGRVGWKFLAL
jgi:hypothetical protein